MKVVALWVDDARKAWEETTSRGAVSVAEPYVLADERGRVVLSSIQTYGDTIHTFVERSSYSGPFLPGYRAVTEDHVARPTGLIHIDHMVGNVGWHEMEEWVQFYSKVMGFSGSRIRSANNSALSGSSTLSRNLTMAAVLFTPSSAALEALAAIEPDELTPRLALEALYRLKSLA